MDRERLVENLNKELNSHSKLLTLKYKASLLAEYEAVEKEIQVQEAYMAHEGILWRRNKNNA